MIVIAIQMGKTMAMNVKMHLLVDVVCWLSDIPINSSSAVSVWELHKDSEEPFVLEILTWIFAVS